jgi:DMSO/TMAO reductase YedYZ molybdopterin-dependent catalytic subunit
MRDHGSVTPVPRWLLALAGVVTGLAGIAVSHAATQVLHVRASPVQAVAEVVVVRTPGQVAEALISVVGRKDKPLLVAGVTVAVLLLAVFAGLLSRRGSSTANLVFLVMALLAGAALWTRPGFRAADLLPLALGTATWIAVLGYLSGYLRRRQAGSVVAAPTTPTGTTPASRPQDATGRRGFLFRAGAVLAVAAVVGLGGGFAGRARRVAETGRRLLRLPASRGSVPAGASVGVDGVAPWRVDNGSFYRIDTALVVPTVDAAEWSLRIHGMVERELTLGYRDLLDRRLTEDWVTICCVSNPVGGGLIGNAWWSGVRIADVLAELGVSPDADAVKQTSKDGWTCGTPLEALTDGRNAMLAVAMNGEPLPLEHGFPVRMIVPGLYGYVSATKWLVDLEVTRFDRFTAYWTERGWSARGPVKTESRIDVPRDGDGVPAGRLRVGGSAWAQHTGIAKVEYRLDGQPWQRAALGGVPNRDTWVQWAGDVDLAPGDHTLTVRATDRSGYTQTPVRHDVVPDGATGWHTVGFTAT